MVNKRRHTSFTPYKSCHFMHSSSKRCICITFLIVSILGTGSASSRKFRKQSISITGTIKHISKPLKDCRGVLCVNIYFCVTNLLVKIAFRNRPLSHDYVGITPMKCNIIDVHIHIAFKIRNVQVQCEQCENGFILILR